MTLQNTLTLTYYKCDKCHSIQQTEKEDKNVKGTIEE